MFEFGLQAAGEYPDSSYRFQFQQILFGCEPASVTGERPVATDHSMAGNENGDGVCSVGIRYGANGVRYVQSFGHFTIRKSLSIRDLQ